MLQNSSLLEPEPLKPNLVPLSRAYSDEENSLNENKLATVPTDPSDP